MTARARDSLQSAQPFEGATMIGLAEGNELTLVFQARRAEGEQEVIRAITAVAGESWNQRYRVHDGRNR